MIAHQGGWDEVIVLLAPLVLFGLLVLLRGRRQDRTARDRRDETDEGR